MLDQDIEFMSRDKLKQEIIKLRTGIRYHRDATGHDLCWWWPELWLLLPEKKMPENITLPSKEEFLGKCNEYHSACEREINPKEAISESRSFGVKLWKWLQLFYKKTKN